MGQGCRDVRYSLGAASATNLRPVLVLAVRRERNQSGQGMIVKVGRHHHTLTCLWIPQVSLAQSRKGTRRTCPKSSPRSRNGARFLACASFYVQGGYPKVIG